MCTVAAHCVAAAAAAATGIVFYFQFDQKNQLNSIDTVFHLMQQQQQRHIIKRFDLAITEPKMGIFLLNFG